MTSFAKRLTATGTPGIVARTLRTAAVTLAAVALFAALPGTALAADQTIYTKDVSVEGTVFGNASGYETGTTFDYSWVTTNCSYDYNGDLALFANLLSVDCSKGGQVVIDGVTYSKTAFLSNMGLEDVQYVTLSGYTTDPDDLTAFVIGHRTLTIDGYAYNVFVVGVAGTRDETQDWASNFDVGAAASGGSDPYGDLTGSHPDWTNTSNHKGFDVTATRVKDFIDNYITTYASTTPVNGEAPTTCLLLTGHSRGAAIANILGAAYEDDADVNSYTYTFSCPNTTTVSDATAAAYKTIFNLNDSRDFITMVPLEDWGYKRYGTDFQTDLTSDTVTAAKRAEVTGATYSAMGDTDLATLEAGFLSIAATPADLYTTHTDTVNSSAVGPSEAACAGLGIPSAVYSVSDNGNGTATRTYSNAFFLKGMAELLNNRNAGFGLVSFVANFNVLSSNTPCQAVLSSFTSTLMGNMNGFVLPHETATTYAMASTLPSAANFDHTGGTATCSKRAVCTDCGFPYGGVNPDAHHGGTATCSAKAVCDDCGQAYGELNPDNHHGGTATCISPAICEDCGNPYGSVDPDNHHGGTATCISPAICDDCGNPYGSVDPDNHTGNTDIRDSVDATYDAEGYTGDTYCSDCNVKLEDGEAIPKLKPVVPGTGDLAPLTLGLAFAALVLSGFTAVRAARKRTER